MVAKIAKTSGGRRGSPPGVRRGGRQLGTPNKFNADIKALIIGALNDAGGRAYLAARARDQPVAFMGLLGKVLPLQLSGENGAPIAIDFRWADETPVINGNAEAASASFANEVANKIATIVVEADDD